MSSKEGFYGTKADEGSFRRTWNKEEFRKRAEERDKRERELEEETENKRKALKPGEPARDLLQAREDKVNFDSGVGKIKVVQAVAGVASKQPGFYCEVCDCVVKDSANYLDHINGRKRNIYLIFVSYIDVEYVLIIQYSHYKIKAIWVCP
ncbi:U4/U6.U5 snRNP associated protein, variant 2 [Basidiobolus ranarum]|uniref:U4/U6.U5 snRNP associated protein, variant 2 n=1 Tax=Basidiobolus ranarum TaxID=34480 RepID=A0ABR2WX53_9FUNG